MSQAPPAITPPVPPADASSRRRPTRRRSRSTRLVLLVIAVLVAGLVPGLIASADAAARTPIGKLDVVSVVPGSVQIRGWALDPDTKNPIMVHVIVDNVFVKQIPANTPRSDIARLYPGFGADHGYSTSIVVPAGHHTVCTAAINVGPAATNPRLGCRVVTVSVNPTGSLDVVAASGNNVRVGGWALDPDTTTSITVHLYDGSAFLQATPANTARSDIAAKFPGYGAAHGFNATVTLGDGTHSVCAFAINVGAGTNVRLGCRSITLQFNPTGSLDRVTQVSGGVAVGGWALDPNSTAPVAVDTYADNVFLGRVAASTARPDIAKKFPGFGAAHGFSTSYSLAAGQHQVCVYALNIGPGSNNPQLGCRSITLNYSPYGRVDKVSRDSAGRVVVGGWAIDPDALATSISVTATVDGASATTILANAVRPDVARAYAGAGNNHGYTITIAASAGEHTVCVTGINVSYGADQSFGCGILNAVNVVKPAAPTAVLALGGYGGASVSWTPPATDGGAPINYTVTSVPDGIHTSVTGSVAYITGLKAGSQYWFTVVATNVAGSSAAVGTPAIITQTAPQPQTSPAFTSTSRYIRDLTGTASDLTTMRARGVADATRNPSGHGYFTLLHLGGQDQSRGGVLLSAVSTFVAYAQVVAAVNAYVDGYASAQRPSAPVVIGLSTNSDVDVSAATGATWADSVVDPVVAHAASARYSAIQIAGSNDIEPGFSAGVAAATSWERGFLAATTAPFVFGGSADGCSWTAVNGNCNNGWTAAQMYQLAGGLAPSRIIAVPQIYNTTMAQQWRYISLTGIGAGGPKINFGGVLTEVTACAQSGGTCASISSGSAWTALWNSLRSNPATTISSMPYATDLRIN